MTMDLFKILHDQFRTIQDELKELCSRKGVDYMELQNLCNELRIHIQAEQKHLCPAVKTFPGGEKVTVSCAEADDEIASMLDQLSTQKRNDLPETLNRLSDVVTEHFAEVVEKLFPLLRKNLSPDQIDKLAKQWEKIRLKELEKQIS